jgi:tetratricopeptide (TPR) repeat protein
MLAIQYASKARVKQNNWDLEAVLPIDYVIPRQYLAQIPSEIVTNFCTLLSRDVYSEGDSQALYHYIADRKQQMSLEFLAMLELWLEDELKHYEALRRTYHCVSGVDFVTMDRQFDQRIHETAPIEMVLADEFTLLVTMMFDEIGSVYSYRRDLQEYYRHFGKAILKIGHHLVKDEGMHFNNAAELLLTHHSHRLNEVPDFLEKISALEQSLQKYHKTFFLDHAQEQYRFPLHFNSVITRLILARLGLGQQPTQVELQGLWQWVPVGYNLVPIFVVDNYGEIHHN